MFLTNWFLFFYLVAISTAVGSLFAWIAGICFGMGALCLLFGATEEEERAVKWAKNLLLTAAGVALLAAIIPNKKDLLLIAAGGTIGNFVEHNKDAQQLPADVLKWMRSELRSATDELSPVVQEKKAKLEAMDKEDLVKLALKQDTAR